MTQKMSTSGKIEDQPSGSSLRLSNIVAKIKLQTSLLAYMNQEMFNRVKIKTNFNINMNLFVYLNIILLESMDEAKLKVKVYVDVHQLKIK